jgi:carboxymethylenebutenolidase
MSELTTIQTDDYLVPFYLATPGSGTGPGVIVLHAWWGLNDFFKELCDRLAQAGFVALAPDLYGGKIASTITEAQALINSLNQAEAEAKIIRALDHLHRHPAVLAKNLGVIGFSMGAAYGLWLSALQPEHIKAVVVFYGTWAIDFGPSQAAYLGHYAEVDDWEPTEEVQQLASNLRTAGREAIFHTYAGVGHWFFESNRPDVYNPEAAQLAWERTLAFLKTQLKVEEQ